MSPHSAVSLNLISIRSLHTSQPLQAHRFGSILAKFLLLRSAVRLPGPHYGKFEDSVQMDQSAFGIELHNGGLGLLLERRVRVEDTRIDKVYHRVEFRKLVLYRSTRQNDPFLDIEFAKGFRCLGSCRL